MINIDATMRISGVIRNEKGIIVDFVIPLNPTEEETMSVKDVVLSENHEIPKEKLKDIGA